MKTGEVIKYIRSSKHLKSKDVYTDIFSRPVISKFEKGISDTTTSKFFKILKNLNVTLDEFYYIYNDFQEDIDQKVLTNFAKAFYSSDQKKLEVLFCDIKNKYKTTKKVKYLHYSILIELNLEKTDGSKPSNASLEILKNYLLNCDDWTYYEIVLFTNSLDFYSLEVINILYKRVKMKLIYFGKIKKYRNELFALISNILVLHIERNNVKECNFFYSELSVNVSESNNLMYEKTMLLFFKELLNIINIREYDHIKTDKIIDIFDFLDIPFRKKKCIELLDVVKQNNK